MTLILPQPGWSSPAVRTVRCPSPACDSGHAAFEALVLGRQADGHHVLVERDRLLQLQQRQVVVERLRVEALVDENASDVALEGGLGLVGGAQVVLTKHGDQRGEKSADGEREVRSVLSGDGTLHKRSSDSFWSA